jgi:hypothetical protein
MDVHLDQWAIPDGFEAVNLAGFRVRALLLISQDLDFSDARKFSPGSYGGILLLRLRNPSRTNLVTRVLELFREETADDWVGCFVVVTERKIRVLKPEAEGKT